MFFFLLSHSFLLFFNGGHLVFFVFFLTAVTLFFCFFNGGHLVLFCFFNGGHLVSLSLRLHRVTDLAWYSTHSVNDFLFFYFSFLGKQNSTQPLCNMSVYFCPFAVVMLSLYLMAHVVKFTRM